MLASFPNALCLFFKSEQFQLIDMPIQVGASVDKHGHVKHAHTRIQKVRVAKPAAPQHQASMFDDAPVQSAKKATKLDGFIRKHGGLASLAHIMAGLTEGQQQHIFTEMGKLSGQTAVEVSAMFDHIKPEAPAQDDLFSQPAKESNVPQAVKPVQTKEKGPPQGSVPASAAKPAESTEPGTTGETALTPSLYRYALTMRPPSPGAVPKGFVSHTQDASLPSARHGVLAYDRQLTPAEVKQYELEPLGADGAELQLPKLPAAVRSAVTEALESLRYMADAVKAGDATLADYKDDIEEVQNKLKVFADFADRKGIDKDKALAELGGVPDFSEIKPEIAQNVQKEPAKEPETENSAALPFGVQAGISKQTRRDLNTKAAGIVSRGGVITDADKAILRQYSGNGGCGDSLNEFYTLPAVADAMWQVAQSLGLKGSVLEPSCGPGVFLHTAPVGSRVTGVEMDSVSAKIAKALHGDRHEVANASLERFATQDDRQFDGVLGNVPFGLRGSLIKDDKPKLKTADAYFCDTSMDKCKAGGIVGLIVPTGIMDSRTNRKLREAMLRKGQFLGAQRMPNTAFEHSHTEVTTDVIWFRKYPDDVAGALSSPAITQDHLQAMGVWDDEYLSGKYFTGRGAANVLGTMGEGWRAKAGMGADITVEGSMRDVPKAIAAFKPEAGTTIPSVSNILAAVGDDEKTREKVLGAAMTRPYADKSKVGDTKMMDGIAYVLQGKPPRWHRVDEVVATPALTQGQELAGRIEARISHSTARAAV